jgi:molybdopterin converting factor small subunit
LASITINFIGQWRLYVGQRVIKVEADSINEVKDYIEDRFGPGFREKLISKGRRGHTSIWENSNILLNGKNIKQLHKPVLKNGDTIELLPRIAGG